MFLVKCLIGEEVTVFVQPIFGGDKMSVEYQDVRDCPFVQVTKSLHSGTMK
jgi:hypothetical protein